MGESFAFDLADRRVKLTEEEPPGTLTDHAYPFCALTSVGTASLPESNRVFRFS